MDLEGQMEPGGLLDPATEAEFMDIWLNFLLVLNKAWIFKRDVYRSLGVDIEKRLEDYILNGGQIPDASYMASCFRKQCHPNGMNLHFVEVMDDMERIIQTQLVDRLAHLRNSQQLVANPNPSYYGSWQTPKPTVTEVWTLSDFLNGDQVHQDMNLEQNHSAGEDTLNGTQEPAGNQYEPVWMPSPSWPETAEHLNLEVDNFLKQLGSRVFFFVPLERPALRCNRRKNLEERRSQLEAELAELNATGKCRMSPEAYNEEMTKLKRKLEQNENTENKRKRLQTELEARKELFENVQESERHFKRDVYLRVSTTIRSNYHCDQQLKENMQRTVDAIHDFVDNRKENTGIIDSNTTRNKYRLQLAGWKWENETYQTLSKILERLIRISREHGPSTSSHSQPDVVDATWSARQCWTPYTQQAVVSDRIFLGHLMVKDVPESPGNSEEDEAIEDEELSNLFGATPHEIQMASEDAAQSHEDEDDACTVELSSVPVSRNGLP